MVERDIQDAGEASSTPHPLDQLDGLSAEAISSLRAQWIDTVEELLALLATPPGREGLKELLNTDDEGLGALQGRCSALVGQSEAARLSQAKPGGPLGVPITEEEMEQLRRERQERKTRDGE